MRFKRWLAEFVDPWETEGAGEYVGYRGANSDTFATGPMSGGIYIARQEQDAAPYRPRDGRIYHVKATVRKPFIASNPDNARLYATVDGLHQTPQEQEGYAKEILRFGITYITPEGKQWLQSNGYDAIINQNETGFQGSDKVLIVFNPAQVQVLN